MIKFLEYFLGCFHSWSPWTDPKDGYRGIQIRRCSKCNRHQITRQIGWNEDI